MDAVLPPPPKSAWQIQATPKREQISPTHPHVLRWRRQQSGGVVAWQRSCARCGKLAKSAWAVAATAKESCPGHVAATLVVQNLGKYVVANGHHLYKTGDYVWCFTCGVHSRKVLRLLKDRCSKTFGTRKWYREQLAKGHAPTKAGQRIGDPKRATLEDWLSWRAVQQGHLQDDAFTVGGLAKFLAEEKLALEDTECPEASDSD